MMRIYSIFLLLVLSPLYSRSQSCPGSLPAGMACVNPGATQTISAFSISRQVTNSHSSGMPIMVPLQTATEWSQFYTNPPPGVSVGSGTPCPSSASSAGQTSGSYTCTCGSGSVSVPVSTGWGHDIYTHDSSLCAMAVHAGKINGVSGGTLTYTVIPGHSSYQGTTRNQVTTSSYGSWTYSIYFDNQPCPSSASSVGQTSGTYTCTCGSVAVPVSTGWGHDIYTHDSSLCSMAVHAGRINWVFGGTLTYAVVPGQSSYQGTARNQVTTSSYGSWSHSIYFIW